MNRGKVEYTANPLALESEKKQIQLHDFSSSGDVPSEESRFIEVSPYCVREATSDPAVIATMMSESSAARILLSNGEDKRRMNIDQNRLATGALQAVAQSELTRDKLLVSSFDGKI